MANRKKPQLIAEDFSAWREDPTTQAIVAALNAFADAQKTAWDLLSWEQGEADPMKLMELKTRADAYRALAELSFEDLMVEE